MLQDDTKSLEVYVNKMKDKYVDLFIIIFMMFNYAQV